MSRLLGLIWGWMTGLPIGRIGLVAGLLFLVQVLAGVGAALRGVQVPPGATRVVLENAPIETAVYDSFWVSQQHRAETGFHCSIEVDRRPPSRWAPTTPFRVKDETQRAFGVPFRVVKWRVGQYVIDGPVRRYATYVRVTEGSAERPMAGVLPLEACWRGMMMAAACSVGLAVVLFASVDVGGRVVRARRGGCIRCGYDLTGLTGPCPECGRTAVRPSRAMQPSSPGA